ncbi:CoA-binding protein [Pseudovibrio exalbescens]|uniref:CoA-binding protein n=1 Tax=Pseudovibrio exalbescens TaxID=197461 RepID=A0A1U7JG18_9HYPH|nr:CoA-binding protein [Pseudovibrio exalbescens]OKL43632.1 CoA-binding protein [Pseudovibrio exalbescens]
MSTLTYSDAFVQQVLTETKVIALVGASAKEDRPSHEVMKYLQDKGYKVHPINPGMAGQTLLGMTVYGSLADVPEPIDMVDIFRNSEAAGEVTNEALALDPKPKTIWMQLQIVNEHAAQAAQNAGVKVIMDRCPKIEIRRLAIA